MIGRREIFKRLRRIAGSDSGSALVEMAISSTLTMTVFIAIFQLTMACYTYNSVCEAARESARWAAVRGSTCHTNTPNLDTCSTGGGCVFERNRHRHPEPRQDDDSHRLVELHHSEPLRHHGLDDGNHRDRFPANHDHVGRMLLRNLQRSGKPGRRHHQLSLCFQPSVFKELQPDPDQHIPDGCSSVSSARLRQVVD